ncbi:MAG: uroporphyrinogen-III C-methyltransferase [Gemmatimonadaceae bacterium]|nr:uroporphyrinogen-III C-methyltransferase [Gemmatimonadaceae bacterium]
MTDERAPARQILLIAAHGSSTDERAHAQVLGHTARIATLVPHDVTITGFARGTPSIADAMSQCVKSANGARSVVTVLPFMTSAGHYATQVLPRRLRDALDTHDAARISIATTAPVGSSRRIATLLQRRALRIAALQRWSPADVAIVIVGHGTRRQATSRDTAMAHARSLARHGWNAVQAAFIDDDPTIADMVATLRARQVIVLPFLIGGGAHHLIDIPEALGFPEIDDRADAPPAPMRDATGRTFVLDAPIGSDETLADIAATIASQAWLRNARTRRPAGKSQRGTVHLVGAGPGAPDLISLRGRRALSRADVVLHDRLVSDALLAMARPDARLIDVGKESSTPQSSQHAINAMLIAEAQRGNRVVRLKGGDPFVFGRGSEEVDACEAAGIRVRVTPGISSALAGPAAAGIAVTARHISRGFAVVTASTDSGEAHSVEHLVAFAQVDTLVVLMGRGRLQAICAMLIDAGRDADTPVACIERATLPDQREVRGTLRTISQLADAAGILAPVVIVIGATAGTSAMSVTEAQTLTEAGISP